MDTEMQAPFLIKSVQMNYSWNDADPTDTIIVGLVQGDAVVAEIASMLVLAAFDPFDVDNRTLVGKKQIIFWESLMCLSAENNVVNKTVSIGGGKGIPIGETKGVNAFIYNPSSALLTTGSILHGLFTIKGVWLGD